jgi:hypothetical protein
VTWDSLAYFTPDMGFVGISPGLLHYTFTQSNDLKCTSRAILDPIIFHEFSHLVYYFFESFKIHSTIYSTMVAAINKEFGNTKISDNFADVFGFKLAYQFYTSMESVADTKCYFYSHFKLFCQDNPNLSDSEHSSAVKRALNSILLVKQTYHSLFNCTKF